MVATTSTAEQLYTKPPATQVEFAALGNLFSYHGRPLDVATGLVYFRNRYYDPELARFITADPLGYVDGPSRYVFAMNSPVSYSDPLGLLCVGSLKQTRPCRGITEAMTWLLAGNPEAATEAVIQKREFALGHARAFKALAGRWPEADEVVFRGFDENLIVYGSGRMVPMEGIEPAHDELVLVGAGFAGWQAAALQRAAGASLARQTGAFGLGVGDELAGEALGVSPSVVKDLPEIAGSLANRAPRGTTRQLGPVGDAGAQGLTRMERFRSLAETGFQVGEESFSINPHLLNSLRKSGRRHIDPESMVRALRTKPTAGAPGSRVFVDPESGARFFVNESNAVVGVHPSSFQ